MITIPKNRIMKSVGVGDSLGDIVNSFSIDLTSNYGAIMANRMKENTSLGINLADFPIAFVFFNSKYMLLQDGSVWYGGGQPEDAFTTNEGEITEGEWTTGYSDMKLFNGYVYITGLTKIEKSDANGINFAEVESGLITGTPHIMEVAKNRLYITDNNIGVSSIDVSDNLVAYSSSSTYGIDLSEFLGLDAKSWTITSLKKVGDDELYIGMLNVVTGTGMVICWDGASNETIKWSIELPSGVISACVLDGVHHLIDANGCIKKYAGNSYVELSRLPKRNRNYLYGVNSKTNTRFIRHNGMQTTDRGTILMLVDNSIENIGNDDSIKAGVWEYDPTIGLYHKFAISSSTDYGQTRLYRAGALYVHQPSSPSSTDNGMIICGSDILTTSSNSTHKSSIFYDDYLNDGAKYGSFTTSLQISDTEDTWQKVYVTYKKLLDSSDKFIVKYRTEDDTPTEATITWTDIDRFTTTTDISGYSVGDEVEILQGRGSGKTSHIKSITGTSTYTVILDENYPTGVIGYTAKANLSKWIKAGEGNYVEKKQIKAFTFPTKNTSPFLQIKVDMQWTGKNEMYKLKIINDKNIKE